MVVRILLLLMPLMGMLAGCAGVEEPCPSPDEQWVAVGFYRAGTEPGRWNGEQPIDTTFNSVYAIGTRAELGQRRVENFFLLPLPLAGGPVSFVFRQNDRQDTLSFHVSTRAELQANECGLLLKPHAIEALPNATSYAAEAIAIGYFFPYDDEKYFSRSLAVFVP